VSDILDIDISSNFNPAIKGAKVTDCVGVEATVGGVVIVFFLFLRALLTVLRKVEIESVSNHNEDPSVLGTSNTIELSPGKLVVTEERRAAKLLVKS
jgi:hypothetical protein